MFAVLLPCHYAAILFKTKKQYSANYFAFLIRNDDLNLQYPLTIAGSLLHNVSRPTENPPARTA
jgi:hypothetical protein